MKFKESWEKYKRLWRWRFAVFILLAVTFLILDGAFAYPHIYAVTAYILFITLFIVFVHLHYHETPDPFEVPDLTFPPAKNTAKKFDLAQILLQEFDYVKETAGQAMNDRLTLVNYFLLSAGVVMAGFGLMISEEGGAKFAYRYEVVITLSLIFNSVGWVYFMQIVRLRQAWCESARAMNHLKMLFAKHCNFSLAASSAGFRWKIQSIPRAEKKMTVFYLSALLISILSAAAIGLASTIMLSINLLHESDEQHQYLDIPLMYPLIGFGLALFHLIFQMSMYTVLLEEPATVKNEVKSNEEVKPSSPRLKKARQNPG